MARWARQALPLLLAAVAAAATAARMAAARSPARSAVELHSHYYDIFPSRNRNAASHKWVTHVLRDATELRRSELESVLSGFCAVSGSPVRPTKYNRYRYRLPLAGGGAITGDTYHCCWPCVCDVEVRTCARARTHALAHASTRAAPSFGADASLASALPPLPLSPAA